MGTLLSFTRILRCNPFCRCGYDPVPLKGFSNKGTFIEYKDITRENCPALFSSIDPGMDETAPPADAGVGNADLSGDSSSQKTDP